MQRTAGSACCSPQQQCPHSRKLALSETAAQLSTWQIIFLYMPANLCLAVLFHGYELQTVRIWSSMFLDPTDGQALTASHCWKPKLTQTFARYIINEHYVVQALFQAHCCLTLCTQTAAHIVSCNAGSLQVPDLQ